MEMGLFAQGTLVSVLGQGKGHQENGEGLWLEFESVVVQHHPSGAVGQAPQLTAAPASSQVMDIPCLERSSCTTPAGDSLVSHAKGLDQCTFRIVSKRPPQDPIPCSPQVRKPGPEIGRPQTHSSLPHLSHSWERSGERH